MAGVACFITDKVAVASMRGGTGWLFSWKILMNKLRLVVSSNALRLLWQAVSAIFLASRFLNCPLPDLKWWLAFDCKWEDIEEIVAEVISLYNTKKINYDYVDSIIRKYSKKPFTPDNEKAVGIDI